MNLFETDIEKPTTTARSRRYQIKRIEKHLQRKANAKQILEDCSWPIPDGDAFDIYTDGQSNVGGFYETIRDQVGYVDELVVSTWIMNQYYSQLLYEDIKNGVLGKLILCISNRMQQLPNKRAAYNFIILKYSEEENIEFGVVNTHAKTLGIKTGHQYTNISGSGNWSENPRIENYTIHSSRESYDFRKEILKGSINEYRKKTQ